MSGDEDEADELAVQENIASQVVTAEQLVRANNAVTAFKEQNPNDEPGGALEIIIGEFAKEVAAPDVPDEQIGTQMRIEKLQAIYYRIQAMMLLTDDDMRGFRVDAGKRYDLIEQSAFEAAARATLYFPEDGPAKFDPEEFKCIALEYIEPQAKA